MNKRDRYLPDDEGKKFRRFLRSIPTKAEYILWQELRGEKLGYKFRRQVSIGNSYVVDFYCHELRLIIEIDGYIHDDTSVEAYDERRETWLTKQGYTVIRFTNDQVLFERDVVILCIEDWCYILHFDSSPS